MSNSKPKKGTRPIKTERECRASDQEGFHDSNNNFARAPDWKSFLGNEESKAPKEDVYQFEEEDDDDESLEGVKKNIIPKPSDTKRALSNGKQRKGKVSAKIPIVKSEILRLKQELSIEEEEGNVQPAAITHIDLYRNNTKPPPLPIVTPKVECRKSSRRRPSVLYLEDPFEIILDSDELEDFDFENGDLYLSRKSDGIKKAHPRGSRKTPAKPRVRAIKQEKIIEPEPIPVFIPPQPEPELEPDLEPEIEPDPEPPRPDSPIICEIENEPDPPRPESPIICEYRIAPIDPKPPPVIEKPPQINPIFLWARQEDSLIVDVRCEDYDKRNRIRLTKSANGSWRAMPRTEANSVSTNLKLNIKSGLRNQHKRRSKQKKSKKKKKRRHHHRRHHRDQRHERIRIMSQHKMPSCKVSLVPLPDLMTGHSINSDFIASGHKEVQRQEAVYEDSQSNLRRQRSVPLKCSLRETHVPNESFAEDCANNNNNTTTSVKRKHVRFALEHSAIASESSDDEVASGEYQDTRGDAEMRKTLQRSTSSLLVRGREMTTTTTNNRDQRTTMSSKDSSELLCNNQRVTHTNNNKSNHRKAPSSPNLRLKLSHKLDPIVVIKEEEDEQETVEDYVGKSRQQKSGASNVGRADRDEIEHDKDDRSVRSGNASPVVVVVTREASLPTPSETPRRREVASSSRGRLHNNNQQCTESASAVICTNTETGSGSGQTPKLQEFSEQGTGIFTGVDDVNNNNCASRVDQNRSLSVLLTSEDEVTVISDSRTGKGRQEQARGKDCASDKGYLVIEDDDEDDGAENQQGRIEELQTVAALQSAVIEIKEQDGDDDVTFVCSKSAIPEGLLQDGGEVIVRADLHNNNHHNNNSSGTSAVLGDALPGQKRRILTPEEQLHESLKATTELIAGGFGFGGDGNMSSFMEGREENCLGSSLGGGGGGLDAKVSAAQQQQQQQHQQTMALQNSLASFCGGDNGSGNTGNLADEYNDDDEMLMEAVAPVADIISRLSDSPKCLTFNEMGEIEFSANAALFEKHTMDSMDVLAMSIKELAEKNIKEMAAKAVVAAAAAANNNPNPKNMTPDSCVTGGGADDYPRDLTCKLDRSSSMSNNNHNNNTSGKSKSCPSPRPVSRGSDAIQSPQPSGLPAVPPSPDMFSNNGRPKSIFLESILSTPPPSKSQNTFGQHQQSQQTGSDSGGVVTKQKEPLDLGTCRKSASPTVTCSEEVSKRHHDEIVDLVSELESSSASSSTSESSRKRIKYESATDGDGAKKLSRDRNEADQRSKMDSSSGNKNESAKDSMNGYLMDILNTNAKDPDPLTQLRLLISNTEWKVPETLLVPKDRLNAVLASPAREIPLLLTTRPELRLPGAFAFPSILQDPDILVVSLAQLEAILEKQQEIFKLKASERAPPPKSLPENRQKQTPLPPPKPQNDTEKQHENIMHQQIQRAISNKLGAAHQKAPSQPSPQTVQAATQGLAGDIDAATIAAFNQMLWLPYLNQMRGQLTPEVIKAVAGFNEMLPLLAAQSRFQQGLSSGQGNTNTNTGGNAMNNPLEFAMWQEAMLNANNANLRALLKSQQTGSGGASDFAKKQMADQQRKAPSTATANFTPPGKMSKHQADHQHLPNPLSPLAIPPFIPPVAMQGASSRYFNPMMAASQQQNNRSPMPSPTNPLHSPFSPNYRAGHVQQQQQQQRGSQRFNMFSPGGGQGQSQHLKKAAGMAMNANQFFPFAQNAHNSMDFEDQMSLLATKKAQKELEQVLQLQQQHQQRLQSQQAKLAQEQKLSKMNMFSSPQSTHQQQMNSFLNSAKMSLHHHQQQQQQQMFNQQMMSQLNELSKLSSLMAMPSAFDSPLNPNPLLAAQQSAAAAATGHDQSTTSHHMNETGGGNQPKLKLKVKPGLHLLDPMAMQRRLLNNHAESSDEMSGEIVSTTTSQSGMDTSSPDINSPLWHPLFGNSSGQKMGSGGSTYTSPWQWTTITTAGE